MFFPKFYRYVFIFALLSAALVLYVYNRTDETKPSWLALVTAKTARVQGNTICLQHVNTIAFTDRPYRKIRRMKDGALQRNFSTRFASSLPNATVVTAAGDSIVTLGVPTMKNGWTCFPITKVLQGKLHAGSHTNVSLTIDGFAKSERKGRKGWKGTRNGWTYAEWKRWRKILKNSHGRF